MTPWVINDPGKKNEPIFRSGSREASDVGTPELRILTNSATQMRIADPAFFVKERF